MAQGDSLYPADWRRSAAKDWHRLGVMLEDGDAEAAAFFLQQSLEKYLKGFPLSHGWALRKIHQLPVLLNDAARHDPSLNAHRKLCNRVSGYYSVERYPQTVQSGLTVGDVETDRREAQQFIRALFPDEQVS